MKKLFTLLILLFCLSLPAAAQQTTQVILQDGTHGSTSSIINVSQAGSICVQFLTPGWDGAPMRFYGSVDGVTYFPLTGFYLKLSVPSTYSTGQGTWSIPTLGVVWFYVALDAGGGGTMTIIINQSKTA